MNVKNKKKSLIYTLNIYYYIVQFISKSFTIHPCLFYSAAAAISWSIKHVCVHTQGASLHADFADSRNKFRGLSVREVGEIFLPPQFHTEAINWSLSQKEQSRLSRQYTCSCSIQEQDYCHSRAFYSGIILSVLEAEAPDVLVWFSVGFPIHVMLHKTEKTAPAMRGLICEGIL